ncbi:hypothetical protein H9L10_04950 [Phycicoccus endophyticus]|uniref:Uncharacterized protein n=1 Tax=Phycicoccus endophyticus TaxID=1690220 RepID=A0A7G9R451_9MICO|nr:hypothetical protein [Phycicoccus endophyticus]NHI18220.1 hypothetical protein [Phycicoccus endophyticus]QNN50376.1 hypothetical protein H9L10_04950 [Phycicoccus endophyticus]GGL25395.1 hypothetical protein GCM10012283_04550 [Phycicoccus endophyticus]
MSQPYGPDELDGILHVHPAYLAKAPTSRGLSDLALSIGPPTATCEECMTLSKDQLDKHELWSTIGQVRPKIASALGNADETEAQRLAEWQHALTFTERLKDVEPWRFPDAATPPPTTATRRTGVRAIRPLWQRVSRRRRGCAAACAA